MSYQYETQYTSNNATPAASVPAAFEIGPRTIEGITIHHWGDPKLNPSYIGIVNYLCRAGGNTSAHYVVTGTDRKVACIVDPVDAAWHAGSKWGNVHTIGIELDPRARDEDYDVAAELIADIRSAYGDVPIYWHSYFTQTACPGAWNADRLDALSYTKYSHATEWGQGGTKNQAPAPAPAAPAPVAVPAPTLYKLVIDGKQVAAYSNDSNAYKGYVEYGSKGSITFNNVAVTKELKDKFAPSPTTQAPDTSVQPDTGKPVAEKDGYTEADRQRDNGIASVVQWIKELLTRIFKGA